MQENKGRTASRKTGHDIHQSFVFDDHGAPNALENGDGALQIGLGNVPPGADGRDAGEHGGRCVGHDPDDAGLMVHFSGKLIGRDARRDRNETGALRGSS